MMIVFWADESEPSDWTGWDSLSMRVRALIVRLCPLYRVLERLSLVSHPSRRRPCLESFNSFVFVPPL